MSLTGTHDITEKYDAKISKINIINSVEICTSIIGFEAFSYDDKQSN